MKASRSKIVSAAIVLAVSFVIVLSVQAQIAQGQAEQGQTLENPVPNPSFEEVGRARTRRRGGGEGETRMTRNFPSGWRPQRWRGEAELVYDANVARTGEKSVMISSETGGDAGWIAARVPVKPFAKYRFTGYMKTEDVNATTGRGAQFNIEGTEYITDALTGTNDWTKLEFEFETMTTDSIQINCLYGGWGLATGKAWFDDVSLTFLSAIELDPRAVIDASKKREPISKYIYGQFIEHLGRCIYGGIWAEMLEDRKFYLSVDQMYDAAEDQEPEEETFPPIPDRRNPQSPWMCIGPNSVKMVTENSYVGEHTPQVTVDGRPAGVIQNRLGLAAGKDYDGRVVLAGESAAAPIKVSLIWGKNPNQRQTVTIKKITSDYVKYPVSFKAGADSINGKLEIVGTGKGKFLIGTASLMPADNIKGMRADTMKLLKELNAPVYRWPGGNFVSGYDWKDGINPDRDKRPPRTNPAWTGIEHNDFGMHEFIEFCKILGTESMIAVNTGLGTVEQTALEVEYANGSTSTEMGRLRAKNGSAEPFNVRFWCVGNEMYGNWQLGNMPLEEYVLKHNDCAAAMKKVDPTIKLIAVGSVGDWDEMMMDKCADYMDLISEHFYCQERNGLMSHIAWPAEHIKRISDAHRRYRQTIESLEGKDIRIAMDEWNFWYGTHVFGELGTRYFLKDALGIAQGLNEYFRNTDIVYMANYAQTVNVIGCIKTNRTAAEFATTGLVLKLYRKEYGTVPVEVAGDTLPLDVGAALSEDGKKLTISIINPTEKELELPLKFKNIELTGSGKKWVMTGDDPEAYNEPGEPRRIDFVESSVSGLSGKVTVPPISATLYSLQVK